MANQDILFPLLPRNTRVDITDRNLRVKRVVKKPASGVVEEEEVFDPTQDARVRQHMHRAASIAKEPVTQEPMANEPIAKEPIVADPRRRNIDCDEDDHKGTQLDTFV